MEMLVISLLGTPEIRLNEQLVSFATRKALALLVYVLVERGSHTRDALAALFWADFEAEQARTSLRQTLAYIRKALPLLPFEVTRDTLMVEPNPMCRIDVVEIEQMMQQRAASPLRQSRQIPLLQSALAAVRGGFLTGFSLADAPEFDDWATRQREYYQQRVVQLFDTLTRLQLDTGLLEAGLIDVGRWLAFDRLDETAYQRQMQLYLGRGDRAGALQSYRQCEAMLAQEFGLEPDERTKSLARQAQATRFAGESVMDAEAEGLALNRMATTIAQTRYDQTTALDLLRQALHFAEMAQNPILLTETEWNLAQTYLYMGQLEQALAHGERAVRLARAAGRDELLGKALNVVGFTLFMAGQPYAKVAAYADEGEAVFRRIGLGALASDCQMLKVYVLVYSARADETLALAREVQSFGSMTGNDWAFASAAYNVALALLDRGDIVGATEAIEEGWQRAKMAGHPPLVFFNMLVYGMVQRAGGDTAAALKTHDEAFAFVKTIENPFMRLLVVSELCVDQAVLGEWAQACAYALEARTLRQSVPYPGFARGIEIEALLHEGYVDEALADWAGLRDEAQRRPDNLRLPTMLAYVDRLMEKL